MSDQAKCNDAIVQKTRELCQSILDDPGFKETYRQIETFMGDSAAQDQYRSLSEKGQELHQKQHMGEEIDAKEVQEFDKEREAFFANAVAAGFVEAQERMQQIQDMIGKQVEKTFELGRLPEKSDFREGCCGGGHHHHGDEPHEHGDEGCGCKH